MSQNAVEDPARPRMERVKMYPGIPDFLLFITGGQETLALNKPESSRQRNVLNKREGGFASKRKLKQVKVACGNPVARALE